jgi:hypothetical protein
MKRIGYETQVVPSWSWMAYDGSIKFMYIPFNNVDWMVRLRSSKMYNYEWWFKKKGNAALVTDIGGFWNCNLEQRETNHVILDSSKTERGEIWYDLKAS